MKNSNVKCHVNCAAHEGISVTTSSQFPAESAIHPAVFKGLYSNLMHKNGQKCLNKFHLMAIFECRENTCIENKHKLFVM